MDKVLMTLEVDTITIEVVEIVGELADIRVSLFDNGKKAFEFEPKTIGYGDTINLRAQTKFEVNCRNE